MDLTNYSDYLVWAGRKVRSLVKKLSNEEFTMDLEYFSYNSIKEICFHIIVAQEYCLYVLHKGDFDVLDKKFKTIYNSSKEEFLKAWDKSDQALAKEFQTDLETKIIFQFDNGKKYEVPKYDFLLQYPSHTLFHRGQLIIALKKIGKKVVGTDYLFYLMEINAPIA